MREPGGGGGNFPPHTTRKLWGRCPLNFWLLMSSILFCLFLRVNLGPYQKIVGQIRGVLVLGRGYLGPRETFALPPPPPQFKIVPASL